MRTPSPHLLFLFLHLNNTLFIHFFFRAGKKLVEESNRKFALQGTRTAASPGSNSREIAEQKAPEAWDRQEVARWLEDMGLGQYTAVFAEKAINGKYIVTKMTEEKLALIISDPFHRERIMDEIEILKNWHTEEVQLQRREAEARLRRTLEEQERQKEEERRNQDEQRQKNLRFLRSSRSDVPARITFENNLTNDIRLNWVDTNGEAHLKRFLTPHETCTEDTFEGHVWQIIDDRTGQLLRAEVATAEPLWISAMQQVPYEESSDLPSYDQASGMF